MNKFLLTAFVACCTWAFAMAQFYSSTTLFPGQTGETLLLNLKVGYKPSYLTLNYTGMPNARDTLYVKVYKDDQDSVECFYTGMKRHLPDYLGTTTARAHLLDNGGTNGINAEHAYPQSKGADIAGREDMHILFPARAGANSGRSNWPYGEIPDNLVTNWYIGTTSTSARPPENQRHLYSKLQSNVKFEPRDKVKGNVARAVFYFYTMYKAEADSRDPDFFELQRETLCRWHMEDPVDSLEWHRTWIIAGYQQDKPNPFILDCSLAKRTYCNTVITDACAALSADEIFHQTVETVKIFPNPVQYESAVYMTLVKAGDVRISVLDALGREVAVVADETREAGEHIFQWQPAEQLANGMYFYRITVGTGGQVTRPINLLR